MNRGYRHHGRVAHHTLLGLCLLAWAGCGDGDSAEPICIAADAQCAPAYEPTWDNVYNFTIARSCSAAGVSCHGRDGMAGGLALFNQAVAYDGLLGGEGGHPRVTPGDPACSSLYERLATTDAVRRMPQGSAPLSAGQICAVGQWIAQGANR